MRQNFHVWRVTKPTTYVDYTCIQFVNIFYIMTILFSPKQNLPFTIVILPPMNHSDTQKFPQMIPKTTLKYPDNYTACNMCIDDTINESYVPKCYINEISTTLQRFFKNLLYEMITLWTHMLSQPNSLTPQSNQTNLD